MFLMPFRFFFPDLISKFIFRSAYIFHPGQRTFLFRVSVPFSSGSEYLSPPGQRTFLIPDHLSRLKNKV